VTILPEHLVETCRGVPERMAWLEKLPRIIRELQSRWSLSFGAPWSVETSAGWVAPAVRSDGTRVLLKLGLPHLEGEHELEGLRFWDGEPTVRVLDADAGFNALLLERCEPGTALRELPEPEQDIVIAGLLRRLWRKPSAPFSFRPLSLMLAHWSQETMSAAPGWSDAGLVREGLRLFKELSASSGDEVLLATDLHAGNVLRAQREPWLVIDPKPFVGDRAYDATQHLLNCKGRLSSAPGATIRRFADLLDVDHERVRLWTLARLAAEPRSDWKDDSTALARMLG
jgi:streptomycin 6-kinase